MTRYQYLQGNGLLTLFRCTRDVHCGKELLIPSSFNVYCVWTFLVGMWVQVTFRREVKVQFGARSSSVSAQGQSSVWCEVGLRFGTRTEFSLVWGRTPVDVRSCFISYFFKMEYRRSAVTIPHKRACRIVTMNVVSLGRRLSTRRMLGGSLGAELLRLSRGECLGQQWFGSIAWWRRLTCLCWSSEGDAAEISDPSRSRMTCLPDIFATGNLK